MINCQKLLKYSFLHGHMSEKYVIWGVSLHHYRQSDVKISYAVSRLRTCLSRPLPGLWVPWEWVPNPQSCFCAYFGIQQPCKRVYIFIRPLWKFRTNYLPVVYLGQQLPAHILSFTPIQPCWLLAGEPLPSSPVVAAAPNVAHNPKLHCYSPRHHDCSIFLFLFEALFFVPQLPLQHFLLYW